MFSASHLIELLITGWLATIPLAIGSILTLAIFFERVWKFRGVEDTARELSQQVIDKLVKSDLEGARDACKGSDAPIAAVFLEALRWKNIALEDLERIISTARAELLTGLRGRIWLIGTTGSLAPFVGLFGTVIGIIRAFAAMAEHGSGGFAIVANGISEALVATALGLGVAIVALFFYNYLQTRITALTGTYARASEHFVQALLYIESSSVATRGGVEVAHGSLGTAGR